MRHEGILTLISLAHALAASADGLNLDEMARHAGATRRTAERYRDVLREVFPQIEEVSDGRSKRFRIRGGLSGFLNAPTIDELAELDVAARMHESAGDAARAALLRRLKGKILAAIRPDLRRRLDPDLDALIGAESFVMQAGPRPMAPGGTLATLRHALITRQVCQFDYGAPRGKARRRAVAPYGVLYGKTYFLVGPERGKPDPVLWRFDRISNLEVCDEVSPPPDGFNLSAFAARSFGAFQEAEHDIVLRFSPSAASDAANFLFHPSQQLNMEADGSLEVRFRAGGLLELVRHLFTWGTTVTILAPETLKQLMVSELRAALAATGSSASD